MKTRLLLTLIVACWGGAISLVQAQSTFVSATRGLVRGTVSDEALGALPGISLVIEGAGVSYEATTDEDGAYQANVLRAFI